MPRNAAGKVALSGLDLAALTAFVKELGLPAFRAKQIHTWIYVKYAGSFDEMTDLSVDLREKLKEVADVASSRDKPPRSQSRRHTQIFVYFARWSSRRIGFDCLRKPRYVYPSAFHHRSDARSAVRFAPPVIWALSAI